MDFSIVKLFPDNLVKALCDTLIHSLWQGLILAALTGLIIVFTRKSASAKRYNLLIASLALFAIATICTFIIALNHTPGNMATAPAAYNQTILNLQPVLKYNMPAIQKATFTGNAIDYFNRNAATIVLIWFMIVCARCLQLATGLQGIYYLRHKNIFKIDKYWEHRVQELAQNLGIGRMISIAESGLAKAPMVIGHLKPLILIPVGLLTAVPVEEIEAILIHELAHIRRSDYFVNLLQSLMEIVFFFNPAVLWISALIKTERENCCDDIAVAQSSSKVNYIKALVSCQEYNTSSFTYAMALKGNKNHLKDRVTRIISNNNHSLNRVEKSLLAICLVIAGLFTAAFSNAGKINKMVTNTTTAVMHAGNFIKKDIIAKGQNKTPEVKITLAKTDTVIHSKLRIFRNDEIGDHTSFQISNYSFTSQLYKEKGVLYQLNYKNKALVSMQVNGKTIPADQIISYQSVIDQIPHKNNVEYAAVNENVNNDEKTTYKADNKANYNVNVSDKKAQYRMDSVTIKLKTQNLKLNGSLQSINVQQQKLNEIKALAISDSVNQTYKKTPIRAYQPKSAYNYQTKSYEPQADYVPNSPDYKPYTKISDNDRRDKIIAEMITDGIIHSRDNLSFKISTSEFIVNGKKQPNEIYQKYREKYVKAVGKGNGKWSWLYNYDTDEKRESNTVIDKSTN